MQLIFCFKYFINILLAKVNEIDLLVAKYTFIFGNFLYNRKVIQDFQIKINKKLNKYIDYCPNIYN